MDQGLDIIDVKKHYTSLAVYYEINLSYAADAWERAYRQYPAGYQETFHPEFFIGEGSSYTVLFEEREYLRIEKFLQQIGMVIRVVSADNWPRFGDENWRKTNDIYPMPGKAQFVNNNSVLGRRP